jgi:hypothetical protein
LIAGATIVRRPVPLHTWQVEIVDSSSNGSLPVPLQKAQSTSTVCRRIFLVAIAQSFS